MPQIRFVLGSTGGARARLIRCAWPMGIDAHGILGPVSCEQ